MNGSLPYMIAMTLMSIISIIVNLVLTLTLINKNSNLEREKSERATDKINLGSDANMILRRLLGRKTLLDYIAKRAGQMNLPARSRQQAEADLRALQSLLNWLWSLTSRKDVGMAADFREILNDVAPEHFVVNKD